MRAILGRRQAAIARLVERPWRLRTSAVACDNAAIPQNCALAINKGQQRGELRRLFCPQPRRLRRATKRRSFIDLPPPSNLNHKSRTPLWKAPQTATSNHKPPWKAPKAPPPPTRHPKNEPISTKCPTRTGEAKNPTHRKCYQGAQRPHQKGAQRPNHKPAQQAHQKRSEPRPSIARPLGLDVGGKSRYLRYWS